MIILADLHLREESADTVFNHVLPEVAQAAVDEMMVSQTPAQLAILGDVLTFRYKIDARLQNLLVDALRAVVEKGVFVRIIPGNHDQYEVGGRNALEPLDEMKGVSVFTQPQWDPDGLWIPYRKNPEDIAAALRLTDPFTRDSRKKLTLFLHHGIRGAMMNDLAPDSNGLPLDWFQNFGVVLLGHYHGRQTIGNCHYIGSPYQTKADESNQEKGYAVWNGEQISYVTTDWGKRYHHFNAVSGEPLDLSTVRPGDEVRVKTTGAIDPQSIIEQLQKSGVEDHVVTPEVEVTEARLSVPENSGLGVYARAYVDAQTTELDKERLMSTFGELTGG